MSVTIGADPEVFISDNGEIISAIGHVGGSKEEPVRVLGGAVQEDNVLAEFNIDPAHTVGEFTSNIKAVMSQLQARIDPHRIVIQASHEFSRAALMRSGRKALMFGCDPDFNAYTGQQNVAPSAMTGLRTAGGHIHIGYKDPDEETNQLIIKACDILLGIPSVVLDSDTLRRKMYGRAGCYRNKPYGVEYRTLSNFWLHHRDIQEWAYHQAVESVNLAEDLHNGGSWGADIEQVINTSDVVAAKKLIKKYGVVMP